MKISSSGMADYVGFSEGYLVYMRFSYLILFMDLLLPDFASIAGSM